MGGCVADVWDDVWEEDMWEDVWEDVSRKGMPIIARIDSCKPYTEAKDPVDAAKP